MELEIRTMVSEEVPSNKNTDSTSIQNRLPRRRIPDLAAQQVMSSQAPGQDAEHGQMAPMSLQETDHRILLAEAKDLMYLLLSN